MGRMLRARTSPALVVAMVALVAALGGVSVAQLDHLTKNSVNSKHLGKGSVGSSELKNGAVKAQDLQDGSVAGVQSGVVDAAGTSTANTAVSVTHPKTGQYVLTFDAGTWSGQGRPLAMTVTPFSINGAVVNPVVTGGQRRADGSATFVVELSSTQPGYTAHDNGFMFIAATSG